ncbi:ACP phosphodiesterase [Olivibacter ginsenosidimutans]
MNFLSHFYFERKINDPQRTLGVVLPDLLRNMDREIRIFPEKNVKKYLEDDKVAQIFKGWTRHIATDKFFHNNIFFIEKTQQLKAYLSPVVINTPIRASFLSHIALELLLDRLLLKNSWLHEDDFYQQLADVDKLSLETFLRISGIANPSYFLAYFSSFIADRYLGSYRNMAQLSHALNQVCKKFWSSGLNDEKKLQLTAALTDYEEELAQNFKVIFNETADYLQKNYP